MNRVRMLREQKNLTQVELGRMLKVQNSAISKYETGRSSLTDDLIIKLCDIFNVTADYLLGRVADPKSRYINLNQIETQQEIEDNTQCETDLIIGGSEENINKLLNYLDEEGFNYCTEDHQKVQENALAIEKKHVDNGFLLVDNKEIELITHYRKLSIEEKGEVRGFIRGLTMCHESNEEDCSDCKAT